MLAACGDEPAPPADTADAIDEVAVEVVDTREVEADVAPETLPDAGDDTEDGADPADGDTHAAELPEVEIDVAPEVTARCGDGQQDPGEACDDGDLDDLDGCDRACAETRVVRAPRPGEVVINELMINPAIVPDPRGEWIELTSIASDELNLSGCSLVDDGTDRVALERVGGRVLAAGGIMLVAGDSALSPALVMTSMLLDDQADEVMLVCAGEVIDEVIDRVAWTPFTWPVISGRALSLDPSRRDAAANDAVDSWCAATAVYAGDRGTPGAPNPACAHLDRTVDHCRLLGDATATGFADAGIPFEVEVEELGLTDLTPSVDSSPELVIEVGNAAGNVDPAAPETFTWVRTIPLAGYQAPVGSRADVWRGEVVAPAGTRRVMARASRDGGASWRYCDRDGSDNGVSTDQLTTVSIGVSPCAAVTCAAPPDATCAADGVRLLGYVEAGTCVPLAAGAHRCDYAPTASDCGALGRICEDAVGGAVCGAVPRTPVMGDLLVSEVMVRPTAPDGQWIELRSRASEPLLLTGCVIGLFDATNTFEWVIEAPTVIAPDGYVVLGETDVFEANGGAAVDRAWGEAFGEAGLANSANLMLTCGEVLDAVTWDASWPGVTGLAGASMSLSPLRGAPIDNDNKESWCRATASFGAGDRGTPGAPNPSCPGDIVPVESCHLAATTVTPPAGTSATLLVHVVASTWTARTLFTDANAKLVVEVGIAPRGAGPDAITTWSASVPDTAWTASGAGVAPAEDRYIATYRAPQPGSWDAYARATADAGNTWVTCDRNQIVTAGIGSPVAVNPVASACWPDPCVVIPADQCRPVASGSPTEVIASSGPAACSIDGNSAECTFIETVAEDCADYGAVCAQDLGGGDGARCAGFPRAPAAGEMVIAELVIAPGNLEAGEWIELQSTIDDALDLTTCGLRSGPAETWDFPAPPGPLVYVVGAREAVTVARSGTASVNGNAQPIMVWTNVALANDVDWVELVCGGVTIDRVAWGAGWTIPQGTSLQLSGTALDARSNDAAANYCAPGITSPGVPNRVCPGDGVLDDCRVLIAATNVVADAETATSVLVFDPGVTDERPIVDPAMNMLVEVGIGPESAAPMTSFAWHWVELEPDDGWDDRVGGPAGWDRWSGAIAAGVVGNLRLLGRVSLDGGGTWTLCGATTVADAAADGRAITSRAGVCAPSPCTTPPAATCSGNTLTGYAPRGSCVVADAAECSYPSETFSCASYGGCNAGVSGCNATPGKPSAVGSLVITEVMRDSTLPAPDRGEWIEIHNTGIVPLDLRGCELVDGAGGRTTITRGVPDVIAASGHAVFAHSPDAATNGGISAAFGKPRSLGDLTLGNGSGSVAIVCGGVEIDRVSWSFGWPGHSGVSMQLDRLHINAADNDLRANWCASAPTYGSFGNKGSPGSLNPTCP